MTSDSPHSDNNPFNHIAVESWQAEVEIKAFSPTLGDLQIRRWEWEVFLLQCKNYMTALTAYNINSLHMCRKVAQMCSDSSQRVVKGTGGITEKVWHMSLCQSLNNTRGCPFNSREHLLHLLLVYRLHVAQQLHTWLCFPLNTELQPQAIPKVHY